MGQKDGSSTCNQKEEMIEKVLKELAREDTKDAKAMKHAGFYNL